MASELGDLPQIALQQARLQHDEQPRRVEDHQLPHDVRAPQRLHGLDGAVGLEGVEQAEEVLEEVGQVLLPRLLLRHDGTVEAGELGQAVQAVVGELGVVSDLENGREGIKPGI